MTNTIQRLQAGRATAEDVYAALQEDGCVVVEGLAPEGVIDGVLDEMAPYLDDDRVGRDDFSGKFTQRTGSLIARAPSSHILAMNELVLGACEKVLGPNCLRFQLHLSQIIKINPGESLQMIHRDRWAFVHDITDVEPELHTIWALTDFTDENGATLVIPGSHEWDKEKNPDPADTVPAEMPKGSAFFYTGSVYHGGGANRSQTPRIGLSLGYNLGWLRQEENQYLSCPPEVASDLTPELAALIGYTMGGYALGYFGDLKPPETILGNEVNRPEHGLIG